MAPTPEERSVQMSLAAATSWTRTPNRRARTRPAYEARVSKFADQVDPNHLLTPEDRFKRGESALKADLARMRLRSIVSRRKAAEARAAARELDAQAAAADVALAAEYGPDAS